MDVDGARRFLRDNHRAVLATSRSDGTAQLSPVLAGVDSGGRVIISTREPTAKVANLRRDPSASLCVMNDRFFGQWVQVDGQASIVSLPEAMEPLVDYYRRLAGEHDNWEEYRRRMHEERRVLIRIEIRRVAP